MKNSSTSCPEQEFTFVHEDSQSASRCLVPIKGKQVAAWEDNACFYILIGDQQDELDSNEQIILRYLMNNPFTTYKLLYAIYFLIFMLIPYILY